MNKTYFFIPYSKYKLAFLTILSNVRSGQYIKDFWNDKSLQETYDGDISLYQEKLEDLALENAEKAGYKSWKADTMFFEALNDAYDGAKADIIPIEKPTRRVR